MPLYHLLAGCMTVAVILTSYTVKHCFTLSGIMDTVQIALRFSKVYMVQLLQFSIVSYFIFFCFVLFIYFLEEEINLTLLSFLAEGQSCFQ